MKKRVIGIVAAAAIAALVIFRLVQPEAKDTPASLPTVVAGHAETGSISVDTELTGTVEPADMAYVIPKAGGEITELLVKPGDQVSAGQKLVHIDTKMVDSAKIAMDTAQVSVQDANRNLTRMQALAATGDVSQQELENAQSQARQAQLQYDSAKINYNNQIGYADVTAPISGTVESVSVALHDNVAQGSVICVISGQGGKEVTFYVPDRIIQNINSGDAVTVTKNGTDYPGTITEKNSMVDSTTALFKVKASVGNVEALPTGVTVEVYVTSEKADHALLVPSDAVYYEGGQPEVYVLDGDTVHVKPVTTGIYTAEKTQITDGITADDEIITSWSSELYEGAKVQKSENAETSVAESGDGSGNADSTGAEGSTDAADSTDAGSGAGGAAGDAAAAGSTAAAQ